MNSSWEENYLNILSENWFLSMPSLPTRLTDHSETCINHIFAKNNLKRKIETARTIYKLWDHYPIMCKIVILKQGQINFHKQNIFKIDCKLLEQKIAELEYISVVFV